VPGEALIGQTARKRSGGSEYRATPPSAEGEKKRHFQGGLLTHAMSDLDGIRPIIRNFLGTSDPVDRPPGLTR